MTIADAWNDLETELLGDPPDYESEPVALPDLDAVNRELRRVAKIRRERDTFKELVEAEIARIRAVLEHRTETLNAQESWHLDRLRRYHEAALRLDPKAKTIGLPNGSLKARAGQARFVYDDEEACVSWLADNAPDMVRVKREVDKVRMKARLAVLDGHAVSADGEIVPGVSVLPGETSFTVDTGEVE